MAQHFSSLLSELEETILGISSQKISLNINFTDLKRMNRLIDLFSEMKFLTEIYRDWNVQKTRRR